MTPAQADSFARHGYLHLEGFYAKKLVGAIRQKVLDEFKRLGMSADGKRLPKALQGLPVFQQIGKLSALVNVPGLHAALVKPELIECVTRLGGRTPPAIQESQLLLSPPHQAAWSLEGLNWHVDVSASPRDPLPGVQAFFLIDDVAPHGGATLTLSGSHRVDTQKSGSGASLRDVLKSSANLEHDLQTLGISIVEMSGRAGDVFLMDMRLLHTPSINATKNVRMMATSRCFLNP